VAFNRFFRADKIENQQILNRLITLFLIIVAIPAQAGTYPVNLPNCKKELLLSIPSSFEPSFIDKAVIDFFNKIPNQTQTMVTCRKRFNMEKAIMINEEKYVRNWVGIAVTELGSLAHLQNTLDHSAMELFYKKFKKINSSNGLKTFLSKHKNSKYGFPALKGQLELMSDSGADVTVDLNQVSILDVSRGKNYVQVIQYFPMRFERQIVPFLKGMKFCFSPMSGCIGQIVIDSPLEISSIESIRYLLENTTLH